MPIFKPKKGPVFKWSRLLHFMLAALITAYGGHLWGYEGSVFAGIGSILMGFSWELYNKFKGRGSHPYGDALDFWSFVLGAVTAGIGWLILGG